MRHLQNNRRLKRRASGLLLLVAVGLAGCAAPPSPYNASGSVVPDADGTPVGANLNGFLSQSRPGNTIVLQQSPWGANVEVMADASYFAASGRECRHLQIMHLQSNRMDTAVACKTADGSWVSQRLVTQTQAKGNSR